MQTPRIVVIFNTIFNTNSNTINIIFISTLYWQNYQYKIIYISIYTGAS